MKEELEERLESLNIELRRQHKKYNSSFINLIALAVILLVFFTVYIGIINVKLREIVTPNTVAALITEELRNDLIKENMNLIVKETVQSCAAMLPMSSLLLADTVQEILIEEQEMNILTIQQKLSPSFHKGIDRIVMSKKKKTDKTLFREANLILASVPSGEVNLNTAMLSLTPGFLADRLREIRETPADQLTRKDQCERNFVLYSMYLNEKGRYRDSRFRLFFDQGKIILQVLNFTH